MPTISIKVFVTVVHRQCKGNRPVRKSFSGPRMLATPEAATYGRVSSLRGSELTRSCQLSQALLCVPAAAPTENNVRHLEETMKGYLRFCRLCCQNTYAKRSITTLLVVAGWYGRGCRADFATPFRIAHLPPQMPPCSGSSASLVSLCLSLFKRMLLPFRLKVSPPPSSDLCTLPTQKP